MKKTLFLALISTTIFFSGCATILSGTTQKINVTSNPEGKQVTIGNQKVVTPSVITVKRSNKDLIVKAKDCNDQKLLKSKINPVFFVNLISGGPLGSTTDYISGAMWKYDENVNLNCK